jgi:uncharacterized protein (TIGR03118 family)
MSCSGGTVGWRSSRAASRWRRCRSPSAGRTPSIPATTSSSDGFTPADNLDPNLVNAWGLAASPTGPWWVAAADSGVATVYDGNGAIIPLVVSIPGIPGPGEPTGMVFNPTSEFVITDGPDTAPASFLFASEDGTISAWSGSVPPGSTQAQIVIKLAGCNLQRACTRGDAEDQPALCD